ncbi:hypothetical protein [Parasitella parasitica]|uniref:CCHC-type domain-containing protein n=1 Tax=Parasitella parasitica TaxID=35722 RepID=A0A0B7N6I1_9FUNG|nr:hypothetical protein [Parasitella parasitica]
MKKAFLLQLGEGDNPALVFFAELKKLRQEVEENLKRLGQNATTPAIPSINYGGANSSSSNASTATEQKNFQRSGNFKSKYKHGGGSGSRGGSGYDGSGSRNSFGHSSNGGSARFGYKKHETKTYYYQCGRRGHLSRDCEAPKDEDKDIKVDIFAHILEALIDTGATVGSVSWEVVANKLNLYTFLTPMKYIQYDNGSSQPTKNKAILQYTGDGVKTRAFPYVVQQQITDIILGMDWMVHKDWALRPKTQELFRIQEEEVQNTQTLKTKEEQRAEDVLKDFPTLILNHEELQTAFTNASYKHRIITGHALPVHVRDYRRPYTETQQIKKEVA